MRNGRYTTDMDTKDSRQEEIPIHSNQTSQDSSQLHHHLHSHKALDSDSTRPSFLPLASLPVVAAEDILMVGPCSQHPLLPHFPLHFLQEHSNPIPLGVSMQATRISCMISLPEVNYVCCLFVICVFVLFCFSNFLFLAFVPFFFFIWLMFQNGWCIGRDTRPTHKERRHIIFYMNSIGQ